MAETAIAGSALLPEKRGDSNPTQRVASLDILRGMVMVLMAIDHVRVFSGLPAGGPTAGLFFTRWITHFCAPWFIFFAGDPVRFFVLKSWATRARLSRYLATRGLMLVLLELTVLRLAWTFNFDYAHYMLGRRRSGSSAGAWSLMAVLDLAAHAGCGYHRCGYCLRP